MKTVTKDDYGAALKALMRHTGQGVDQVAADFGVTRQTVYAWLRGRTPHPAERRRIFDQLVAQLNRLSPAG